MYLSLRRSRLSFSRQALELGWLHDSGLELKLITNSKLKLFVPQQSVYFFMLTNNQLSKSNRLFELASLFWFRSPDEVFISTLREKEKVKKKSYQKSLLWIQN
jgi:hypothetical protein